MSLYRRNPDFTTTSISEMAYNVMARGGEAYAAGIAYERLLDGNWLSASAPDFGSPTAPNKDIVMEKIKDVAGRLIIKEYPTKSASTKNIENHIEKLLKRGIKPDVVIVDYADLLRPRKSSSEKRHELENIYEELRAIAQKHECTVLTASQTNRGGLNAEVITMESISEAFNKCFVADFIYSLSRTPQDKQSNKGRIFIAKNRNGPDGLVYNAFVDWSNVKIKVAGTQVKLSVILF